jgi:hypothetical protein
MAPIVLLGHGQVVSFLGVAIRCHEVLRGDMQFHCGTKRGNWVSVIVMLVVTVRKHID